MWKWVVSIFFLIAQSLAMEQKINLDDFLVKDQDPVKQLPVNLNQLKIDDNEPTSLNQLLIDAKWIEQDLSLIPPDVPNNETVGYRGNVRPTNLYKQGPHSILPTLPVVFSYNPWFEANTIHAAFSFKATPFSQMFFEYDGQKNVDPKQIETCSLIIQNLYSLDVNNAYLNDPNVIPPFLLRLHGFVHGYNAGGVNINTAVNARVDPLSIGPKITFWRNGPYLKDSVHSHDGLASPVSFALKNIRWNQSDLIQEIQGLKLMLPDQKHASLIIFSNELWENNWSDWIKSDVYSFLQKVLQK